MKMRRSALLCRRPFFGSSILPMRTIQCRFPLTFFRRVRALILNSKSAAISRRNRFTTTRSMSPGSAAVCVLWIFPIRTAPRKSAITFPSLGKVKRRSKVMTFFAAIMAYSTWWTDTTAWKFSKARCERKDPGGNMAKNFTICVGTLGMGLWRSPDGGMSWARGRLWKGYQGGRSVFGIAVHPKDPSVIYAGADDGIYRSEDRGANFEHIDSPLDGYKVWRIAIDPVDPSTMFAGTAPPALFRSRDSGFHWEKLSAEFAKECANVTMPR